MNATIYRFPGSRREPNEGVPPDAIPVDREREAIVASDSDHMWCCMLVDDGGGMLLIMRQDFFTYVPQLKLLIMGNNKPNLKSVDDAVRGRFIILPFHNRPARVDPLLPQKLRMEAPGILRWMIEGCLDWQQSGLVRSTRDREATDAYFSTQDLFGQWLAEACDAEPGNEYKRAGSGELFSSWQAYARHAGEDAGGARGFADRLEKRGFEKKHSRQGSIWIGIRLQPPQHWQEATERAW